MGYFDKVVSGAVSPIIPATQAVMNPLRSIPGVANTPLDTSTWSDTLKNTPFDPNTWLGSLGMGGKKEKQTTGANMATPELGDYITAAGKVRLDPTGISRSPWQDMALSKQAAEQNMLLDRASRGASSALAQGMSNLAMRGGLRSGAAERMASSGAENLALARQNILGQGAIERGNLGMQAADRVTDVDKFNALQGMEANKFNANVGLQDILGQNEQARMRYGEGMKLKAAGMSSDAIANSAKK